MISEFFTVNKEVVIDPDEWKAQCLVAERASARTVTGHVAAEQRRKQEENNNHIDNYEWTD
jgi:hypothetical protein